MSEPDDGGTDELDEIIRRIVRVAAPERIILVGSTARGEAGPVSDLDLLVVKAGDVHRRELAGKIYAALVGVDRAVDVIVVTPEDVDRYRNSYALVIAPALGEGRTIYAGPRSAIVAPTAEKDAVAPEGSMESSLGRFAPDDPWEWTIRARSSLLRAQNAVPGMYPEDLCFAAQHAAETGIKAVLIAWDVKYPCVHDLPRLLALVRQAGKPVPIPPEDQGLTWLTGFAALLRDPFAESPTAQDYQRAIVIAEGVVRWAEERVAARWPRPTA